MISWLRLPRAQNSLRLPLFPLKTVLFPGGVLPLKVFEQRYLDMAAERFKAEQPFGICLLTEGEEIASAAKTPVVFAPIGTLAHTKSWDMPRLGILHLGVEGGQRFQVKAHQTLADGLIQAEVQLLAAESRPRITEAQEPMARLLELLISRIGEDRFGSERQFDDASWVSYRLAEILPLKASIKQNMLEVNDCEVRLRVLEQYLKREGLL
ncbi:MAG: LON peptidase substrate-binding domain-containing protein [Betaproteobacteria bacterium]|nr:LON peptidase substrate-binding domain-containing protein [Betaproteobacteria bacterium]